MSDANFYRDLPSFCRFDEITDDSKFHPIPNDWVVFVADIRGSTKAIEQGRYRDVNTIGAATIAAAQNALRGVEFPFSFGGDGATFVVPADRADDLGRCLLGVQALSSERFDLQLRVGSVDVGTVLGAGRAIEVAKFEFVEGKAVAVLRGGGAAYAEDLIKADEALLLRPDRAPPAANLSGLSCRWQPIDSRKGRVVSLLVLARAAPAGPIYRGLITSLEQIVGGELELANPVDHSSMGYKTVAQCARDERRYHRSALSPLYWLRLLEIIVAVLIFRWRIPPLLFDPKRYAASMRPHSDYRKFDDMLRLVIDCTPAQVERLRSMLRRRREAGDIFYGVHESDTALMTCLVGGLGDGEHVHFVDGGDGGYAVAAAELKAQVGSDEESATPRP